MRIRFGVLCKLAFVVNAWIGNFESTRSIVDVGLDIADTRDFGQIASDRGGTAMSVHVGHVEADEGDGLAVRFAGYSDFDVGVGWRRGGNGRW